MNLHPESTVDKWRKPSPEPLWARRVARLGAGARPLPRSKLSAELLAAALGDVVNDPAMLDRARAVSQRLRAEDGVGSATRLIDHHICAHYS